MHCFDQAAALRQCSAELDRLGAGPLADAAIAARTALAQRDGNEMLTAARTLREAAVTTRCMRRPGVRRPRFGERRRRDRAACVPINRKKVAMMHTYRELIIGGVLVAPVISYAATALVIFLLLRPLLHRIGFARLFSNPSLAELSVYVSMFGLLTLFF